VSFTLERPVVGRPASWTADDPDPDPDPHWRRRAACRTCSPDLFFPAGTTGAAVHDVQAAKAVCAVCPVQSPCLRFALTTGQAYGIWGGTTEDERQTLRRWARRMRATRA
jgi:WhiB family redox-sensing transcriptional regulator